MHTVNQGDIVQVKPKKYPELAWIYCEVKEVKEIKKSTLTYKEFKLDLPDPRKKASKKIKKEYKKAKKLLKEISFKDTDLILVLQNPQNRKTDG